MAYLLDANVLIGAKRNYYRFGTFPCFWDYLLARASDGTVRSVDAVKTELVGYGDELTDWITTTCPAGMFEAPDGATGVAFAQVSAWTMDPVRPYTSAARAKFLAVADSELVAHALANGHTVVTHETPDPFAKVRVKIPDVCAALTVRYISPYVMLEEIGARFS